MHFFVSSPLRCVQWLWHNSDTAQGDNDGVFVSAQGCHMSACADLVPQGGQPVPTSHRHNCSVLGQHNLSSLPLFGTHSPDEEPGQPGGDKNSGNYSLPYLGKKKKKKITTLHLLKDVKHSQREAQSSSLRTNPAGLCWQSPPQGGCEWCPSRQDGAGGAARLPRREMDELSAQACREGGSKAKSTSTINHSWPHWLPAGLKGLGSWNFPQLPPA